MPRRATRAMEEVLLEDFQAPAASFDYVVAHGVFSWVLDQVRDRLGEAKLGDAPGTSGIWNR